MGEWEKDKVRSVSMAIQDLCALALALATSIPYHSYRALPPGSSGTFCLPYLWPKLRNTEVVDRWAYHLQSYTIWHKAALGASVIRSLVADQQCLDPTLLPYASNHLPYGAIQQPRKYGVRVSCNLNHTAEMSRLNLLSGSR